MAVLFVGYDLNSPGQDYKDLRTELKKTGIYWNNLDSTWLIVTNETVVQLRDRLKKHLDTNDELLVLDVSGDSGAWAGFSSAASDWLLKYLG